MLTLESRTLPGALPEEALDYMSYPQACILAKMAKNALTACGNQQELAGYATKIYDEATDPVAFRLTTAAHGIGKAIDSIRGTPLLPEEVGDCQNMLSLHDYLTERGQRLPQLLPPYAYENSARGHRSRAQVRSDLNRVLWDMQEPLTNTLRGEGKSRLSFAGSAGRSSYHEFVGFTLEVAGHYMARRLGERPSQIIPAWRDGHAKNVPLHEVISAAYIEVPAHRPELQRLRIFHDAIVPMELFKNTDHFLPSLADHVAGIAT